MRKYIFLLLLLSYPSTLIAVTNLTVFNQCSQCQSIKFVLTVPASGGNPSYDEEKILGDYRSSISYLIEDTGTYGYYGECLQGIEFHWEGSEHLEAGLLSKSYEINLSCVLGCLSKEIYGEDSEETELLRYIRDNKLNQTPEGRELIRLYYQWSPMIVKAMEKDKEFKEEVKELIDGVLELIGGGAE